jgi:hypothetical protein
MEEYLIGKIAVLLSPEKIVQAIRRTNGSVWLVLDGKALMHAEGQYEFAIYPYKQSDDILEGVVVMHKHGKGKEDIILAFASIRFKIVNIELFKMQPRHITLEPAEKQPVIDAAEAEQIDAWRNEWFDTYRGVYEEFELFQEWHKDLRAKITKIINN